MKKRCPECREYTEMKFHETKWNGRSVYKCEKCRNLYLECHNCNDGVAKTGSIYDDFFCEECGKRAVGKLLMTAVTAGVSFIVYKKWPKS